ncbi:MAG: hypothetical protein H0V83_06910 [Rubrobacter sp.]|nr:hypothetical protein [Rubrobacter sp.]
MVTIPLVDRDWLADSGKDQAAGTARADLERRTNHLSDWLVVYFES